MYEIPAAGVFAIALGKAAVPMLAAVEERLGDTLHASIAVTKAWAGTPPVRGRVLIGSHPTPDARSLAAGEAVRDFAASTPRGALVICLISGGGSALVEDLREGITLEELQRVTTDLLRAGAGIHDLNAVRSRLSRIKAGGLLGLLAGCQVCNLVISDVLGDAPTVIASGPTMPTAPGPTAVDVLRRFGVRTDLPETGPDAAESTATWEVVANLSMGIDAAAEQARLLGVEPFVLTRSLGGEARDVGAAIASIVADTANGRTSFPRPICLLAGGETVVTVRGDGHGGRNTECALAAALRLSGTRGTAIGFLATDGDDALTGLAGAIVDGNTVEPSSYTEAIESLARNDSATYLEGRGATLRTGPTGTNVNDLVIALVD